MVRANMAVLLLVAVVVGGQAVRASSTIRQEVKALAGGSVSLRWVETRTHYQNDIRIPPFPPVPLEYIPVILKFGSLDNRLFLQALSGNWPVFFKSILLRCTVSL
jgi:hypothetical protein